MKPKPRRASGKRLGRTQNVAGRCNGGPCDYAWQLREAVHTVGSALTRSEAVAICSVHALVTFTLISGLRRLA